METTFIYGLMDPVTKELRYIGKSDDPQARLSNHVNAAYREDNHKARWIRKLLALKLRPFIQIVDKVLKAEWQAAEAAYIIFFKEEGCDLANSSPGGDGSGAGKDHPLFGTRRSHSQAAKEKISAANKGRVRSSECRMRESEARRGKNNPMFGKHLSPEARSKLSAGRMGEKHHNFGKPLTAEQRSKMSAALKGKKHPKSPETRAKISASLKGEKHFFFGKKHKPETLQKMRNAWEKRRERERAMSGQLELLPAA
jgi:group I intron endonuclease